MQERVRNAKIDVISQLHVLGVNAEDLQMSGWVRDTNVDFTVKATETSQGWVN